MPTIEPLDLLATAAESGAVQAAALGPLPRDRFAVLARHASYPGFTAWGAYEGARLVGYCYGTDCVPGQWWFDQIRAGLRSTGHEAWTLDAHAVTELHVLPSHQGRGLGFGLLSRLLAGTDLPIALLSTYDVPTPARTLYRRCGFVDLVRDFRFGLTAQPFALMGARLPLRTDADGDPVDIPDSASDPA
ncbi:MAG: GNAT family N-acetyltransferase [Sporichthyaceae bacterium]